MTRLSALMFAATLFASLSACKKDSTTAETASPEHAHGEGHHGEGHGDKHGDVEGREVVDNWAAKTGDVTTCPVSNETFEVAENSERFEYQGQSFVFCCPHCLEKAKSDPAKYLDPLVEQAGGAAEPATDAGPEPEPEA